MSRVARAAAVLILVSTGGFLVYRGLGTYYKANSFQREAAAQWRETPRHAVSITRPRLGIIPEGQTFSRLEVPRLNQSLYVVEGDADSALEKGPGHVRGTAMPGENGNCVIAGHRDLHFRFLKNFEPGDKVYLETQQGRFCYRVTGTKIISPDQIQVLQPTRDAELHLITCYPFYFIGHAPKRFVVTAELDQPIDNAPAPMHFAAAQSASQSRLHRAYKVSTRRVRPTPFPSQKSIYERSLEATRALNRAGAGGL